MAQTQCNPSSDPPSLPWARAGQDWQNVALQLRLLLSCGISVPIAAVVGARSRHTAPWHVLVVTEARQTLGFNAAGPLDWAIRDLADQALATA